jgi:hypothetical protein
MAGGRRGRLKKTWQTNRRHQNATGHLRICRSERPIGRKALSIVVTARWYNRAARIRAIKLTDCRIAAQNKHVTYRDLYRKFNSKPFKPFRINLSDSTMIDVRRPTPVIIGEASVVVPTHSIIDGRGIQLARDWRTIALNQIIGLTDLTDDERAG